MALIDSGMVKAVMESPVPIAALAIVCFLAWRQMNLVKTTTNSALTTLKDLFNSQAERQDKFMKDFRESGERFTDKLNQSEKSFTEKLNANNLAVTTLTSKLDGIPVLMEKMIEQKLSMRPDVGSAVEERIKNLEIKADIQRKNFELILEGLKKRGNQQ